MPASDPVEAVHHAVLRAAEAQLLATGELPLPQLHLFADDLESPYLGFVTVPGLPSDKAGTLVQGLGRAASATGATRVLVLWEHNTLLAALGTPDPMRQHALVFLEATFHHHVVTRHPFRIYSGQQSRPQLRWGSTRRLTRPALPAPVVDLLTTWRALRHDDFPATVMVMQREGYEFVWAWKKTPSGATDDTARLVATALDAGESGAVERALWLLSKALTNLPDQNPQRGQRMIQLSQIMQVRYQNTGNIDDLTEAVTVARNAASHLGSQTSVEQLSTLGAALRSRYEQTGDRDCLTEAVEIFRQVAGEPGNRAECLTDFARSLLALFNATGDETALDEGLAAAYRAAEVVGEGDSGWDIVAMTLCNLLLGKHATTGDLALLDEAIDLGRAAVAASAASGWKRAALVADLGRALEAQYRRTGELRVLYDAVDVEQDAVDLAPSGHADRAGYQLNLSSALLALYDRTHERDHLENALKVAREAVDAVGFEHPARIRHLANLAAIHRIRYDHSHSLADVHNAVALAREALAKAPAENQLYPAVKATLGDVLLARIQHTNDTCDLDEAIAAIRTALHVAPDDHPDRSRFLGILAGLLETRHLLLHDAEALPEAIELWQAAARHRTSPVWDRVKAARAWGTLGASTGQATVAAEGFATGVELLPQLAARGLRRHDSEHWLSRFAGLASAAAAWAMETACPERAVEVLELGRAVLIAQALDGRTDLSDLRDRDPDLADRFEWLSAQLETDIDRPRDRQALADELDAVIAAVRDLPGLDRFLLPPTVEQLTAAAAHGQVALINIDELRSDALVLTATGLQTVPLPALTSETVKDQVERFLTALSTDRCSPLREQRARGERTISDVLAWLWEVLAAPVLNTVKPSTPGGRMWWVPTGLLSFLPLHAAGTNPGESILDRVVSSYAPSIRSLLHARNRPESKQDPQTLIVGMPDTPGETPLPGAAQETSIVAQYAPNPHTLIGPDATSTAVIDALENSTWAHFACHATTASSPSNSHLLLHDYKRHPFNAASVSNLRLPMAELAYLSACDTAVPTANLADEAIHIASAFHLAGYPRVIGTLWSINDDAATMIADLVYKHLTTSGPGANRAAEAVHKAITQVRQIAPHQPSHWASHIHIGI